jgi:hypothetical protein
LKRRKLQLADLYEDPFTRFGTDAADRLFNSHQLDGILKLTQTLMITED